jgi:agmatine deiminase
MIQQRKTLGCAVMVLLLFSITFASVTTVQSTISENNTLYSDISYLGDSSSQAIIRQPAEFEPMQGVLIRYPFGISLNIIKEMAEDVMVVTIVSSVSQKNTVLSQYQSYGIDTNHCSFLIAPSDSYWTRDYGPWFIFNSNGVQGIVDFIYNRPRPNDDAIPSAYANNQSLPLSFMALEHTGGNYMTDGQGIAISTTLVWNENPGYTHDQINQKLNEYCGITTYHVVPDVNGEYIEHVDCWGKYLSPDTILIREVPVSHSQYDEIEAAVDYFESQMSCYGTTYTVVRVYTPNNEPYTNSLILNNKVLVPIKGTQWDDEAILAYQTAMPGYEVLGFTGTWESTDALHCRAMGITDRYMLYVQHTPLFGNQSTESGYDIQAMIYPYSGQPLISASTGVYWRSDAGDWSFIPMEPMGENMYHAVIPQQENGTVVSYYIHAEDASDRVEHHPYIGAPDAHFFTAYGELPHNTPPETPQRPSGQASGKVDTIYDYSTVTTDVDGDQVFYFWDWDDGSYSDWLGPFSSGETVTAQHSWTTKGTYSIRVKAKDVSGNESGWSEPLAVTMPRNSFTKVPFFPMLERLFPTIFLFLSEVMNRTWLFQ